MSILLQAAPEPPVGYLILAVLTLAGIAASVMLGVWRRRSIAGPLRLRRADVRPVFFVLLAGLATLFVSQVFYFAARNLDDASQLQPLDWATLAVVPGLLVFITLVIGNRIIRTDLPLELGYHTRRVVPGILIGVAATLVVFPLMYWCLAIMELVYRWIEYEHPQEHDLLRMMGEADDPVVRMLLIGGAVVVAPLWEEFVFRGHLQSLLVRMFSGSRDAREEPVADPSAVPPAAAEAAVLDYGQPAMPAWTRWFAVVMTSAAFAVIHPLWSAPAIFLLSMCLGYVYERSGNLWACVALHALFNLSNTLIFLAAS